MGGDRSLVFEFVGEAKEHLANLTDDLLALEQGRSSPAPYRIDRLFRAVHSIKGGAGFFGFGTLAGLAHAMESLLGVMRDRAEPPTATELEALLTGADRLGALLDDIEHSNDADVSAFVDRIAGLVPATGMVSDPPRSPVPVHTLWPEAAALVRTPPTEAPNLFLICCDLAGLLRRGGPTPAAFVQALQSIGTILDGRLDVPGDLADSVEGPVMYLAVVATAADAATLARVAGLRTDEVSPIQPEPDTLTVPTSPASPAPRPSEPPVQVAVEEPTAPRKEASTIRIGVELLDRLMTLAGELVLVRNQALRITEGGDPGVRRVVQRLNAVTSELQAAVMQTRMQPVGNLFNKFPRLVRDLARQLGKQIELNIAGTEVELDKSILEALADPLTHLVRNCCDHGLELPNVREAAGKPPSGRLSLRARHEGSQILITVADDGRGIDPERIRRKAIATGLKSEAEVAVMTESEVFGLILLPGFSTAERVTDVSGRGVGMDVVKTNLDRLGGSLDIESAAGLGTTFRLRLPLTVAIMPCLLVRAGGERYAVPQKDLEELVCLHPGQAGRIDAAFDREVYRLRDRLLPIVRLNEVLSRPRPFTAADRAAVVRAYHGSDASPPGLVIIAVVKCGGERFGLVVDEVLNSEEIVIKPMQATVRTLRCFSGATILGDGRVALILDIEGVGRHAGVTFEPAAISRAVERPTIRTEAQSVLLFKAGGPEPFAVALPTVRRVEPIERGRIERIGPAEFVTVEGRPTRVVRLDQFLPVAGGPDPERLFLLLPRASRRPVGLLITEVIDSVPHAGDLQPDGPPGEGVLGTAVLRDRLTVFLDLYRLFDRADPASPPALPPAPERKRVLLVEDTQFFRQLVRGYLEAGGYEVETANDGTEGLRALEEKSFDLVISDIEMPNLDGWGLARAVRQKSRQPNIPLMALTTRASEQDRAKSLACGFDHHEQKLDRDRFLAAVATLLRTGRPRAKGG